jgi:hypothetical protein
MASNSTSTPLVSGTTWSLLIDTASVWLYDRRAADPQAAMTRRVLRRA